MLRKKHQYIHTCNVLQQEGIQGNAQRCGEDIYRTEAVWTVGYSDVGRSVRVTYFIEVSFFLFFIFFQVEALECWECQCIH